VFIVTMVLLNGFINKKKEGITNGVNLIVNHLRYPRFCESNLQITCIMQILHKATSVRWSSLGAVDFALRVCLHGEKGLCLV